MKTVHDTPVTPVFLNEPGTMTIRSRCPTTLCRVCTPPRRSLIVPTRPVRPLGTPRRYSVLPCRRPLDWWGGVRSCLSIPVHGVLSPTTHVETVTGFGGTGPSPSGNHPPYNTLTEG